MINKKVRIFHSTGYYSLINLASILKKRSNKNYHDILVIKNDKQNKELLFKIVNIIYNFDTTLYYENNVDKISDILLNIKLSYPEVEEFWDCTLYLEETLANSGFESVKSILGYKYMILYDEGFTTYMSCSNVLSNSNHIKEIILHAPNIVDKYYSNFFTISKIDEKEFKDTLSSLQDLFPSLEQEKLAIKKESILFLSSFFWEDTIEEKKNLASAALIDKLIYFLNKDVYIKAHTRELDGSLDKILKLVKNKDRVHVINTNGLAELLLINNHSFEMIVSYMSSILINSYNIFKIPSFTFNDKKLKESFYYDLLIQKSLANELVPDIEDYLYTGINIKKLEDIYKKSPLRKQQIISPFLKDTHNSILRDLYYHNKYLDNQVFQLKEESKLIKMPIYKKFIKMVLKKNN